MKLLLKLEKIIIKKRNLAQERIDKYRSEIREKENDIRLRAGIITITEFNRMKTRIATLNNFIKDEEYRYHYFYEILCIINSLKQESNETDKIN